MRIAVIGATGTIGRAIVQVLERHEVVSVGHRQGAHRVDLADPASIRRLYESLGEVEAVVCAAGAAAFGPLADLKDSDFELVIRNKLLGQVNLVRQGVAHPRGGACTVPHARSMRQAKQP